MTEKLQSMQNLLKDSYLSGGGDAYLDDLYETYLNDPDQVSSDWRRYFDGLAKEAKGAEISHADIREYFLALAKHPVRTLNVASGDSLHQIKQSKVIDLISAYRSLGHLKADIDPLGFYKGKENPTLELSYYGFTDADLQTEFDVGSFLGIKKSRASLQDILATLRKTYCGTIGIEYMHINDENEVHWLQDRFEKTWPDYSPSREEKLRILDRLVVADGLEKYLGFKYVGQKRFSLEGGDSFIPMMYALVHQGARNGIREIIIGMAHRGRLNVLVNVLGKEPEAVFAGFEGKGYETSRSGDVKYHMGYSADVKTETGPVHLALAFNPSHLEIVSPVVQGSVRSRQRRRRDTNRDLVMPLQIHGDAAFAGQGVVAETFNMSQARWFSVGGSVHIVINNQVGFTTSNPEDARSALYCTDIAKMVQPPILHVNGNDPEAAYFAALLAADYRAKFKRDIVIDLVCYRRQGHNEADEPSATQPIMYKVIRSMPVPASLYATTLLAQGIIEADTEKKMVEDYRAALETGKSVVDLMKGKDVYEFAVKWDPFLDNDWTTPAVTALPLKKLISIANQLEKLPEGFVVQPQVKKMLEMREKMTKGEAPVNWGYAETLAYATLLDEGFPIRLCGQDAGRGTFAHRHAVLHDQNTDSIYIPLSHIKAGQVQINIIDSLLSEEAVLAFEYGYAVAEPNNLVIWEAQFGDFANGAQVVIDQFISSGEQKWKRMCGLVMLLPHGFEGAGPEHSSARLERYLQLCAQENMQVCVPSTPAQIYHLLRRQMTRPYRKPLIVMTPKSLLRHPLAVSSLEELSKGEYQLAIPEIDTIDPKQVERIVLCSGKVYYDLLEARREKKLNKVAILRIEQLYPFPKDLLSKLLKPYQQVKQWVWCQEEPKNQGAWFVMQPEIQDLLSKDQVLTYAGRNASASPAVGYTSVHLKEQEALVASALNA